MHGHFIPLKNKDDFVISFLEIEFDAQRSAYPAVEMYFDPEAAYWAASLVYNCAQLLINREDVLEEVRAYLKPYSGDKNRSSIISADLCLRFLPDILEKLIEIDIEDPLIDIIQRIGQEWHYSFIPICKTTEGLDFSFIESDTWMLQAYAERVAVFQNQVLMKNPLIDRYYSQELGEYKKQLIR